MIPNVYLMEVLMHERCTEDRRAAQQQREHRLARTRFQSDLDAATPGQGPGPWLAGVAARLLGRGRRLRTSVGTSPSSVGHKEHHDACRCRLG